MSFNNLFFENKGSSHGHESKITGSWSEVNLF